METQMSPNRRKRKPRPQRPVLAGLFVAAVLTAFAITPNQASAAPNYVVDGDETHSIYYDLNGALARKVYQSMQAGRSMLITIDTRQDRQTGVVWQKRRWVRQIVGTTSTGSRMRVIMGPAQWVRVDLRTQTPATPNAAQVNDAQRQINLLHNQIYQLRVHQRNAGNEINRLLQLGYPWNNQRIQSLTYWKDTYAEAWIRNLSGRIAHLQKIVNAGSVGNQQNRGTVVRNNGTGRTTVSHTTTRNTGSTQRRQNNTVSGGFGGLFSGLEETN